MKGKKIGIVTTWFERGAAYVSKQFKEVWEQENEIYIYARGGESVAKNDPNWEVDQLTYGKRYPHTRLAIIDIDHFKKWIKEHELDIVFFNEQHLWKPVLAAKELNVTIGSYIDYYTKETVPLFGIYDFLICNTKRHYSVFEWHPQAFYVPWGTDLDVYNETQQKAIDPEIITFFHSAGMNPYRKGTDYVVKAFDRITSLNAKLIIHTQVDITEFFPKLKSLVQRLIQEGKLELIQETVTAPGLYHKGDVYVYPTRLEGIGLTIAEASACGLPVITTNEAPMNEFVVDGENGKLVQVASTKERGDGYYWEESYVDIDDLVEQLNHYISNMDTLKVQKERALKYAQTHLSWTNNSIKLLEVLNHVKPKEMEEDLKQQILAFEKNRGLKFYIGNLVVYQKIKTRIKELLS